MKVHFHFCLASGAEGNQLQSDLLAESNNSAAFPGNKWRRKNKITKNTMKSDSFHGFKQANESTGTGEEHWFCKKKDEEKKI